MSWTDERVAVLRELWDKGRSASEVASELGVTRNAVIGKVHRLGLEARATRIRKPLAARKVASGGGMSRPAPAPCSAPTPTPAQRAAPKSVLPQPVRPPDPDPGTTVTFLDLRPGQCAYILTDRNGPSSRCCGAPTVPGKPYCAEHLRRCVSTVTLAHR